MARSLTNPDGPDDPNLPNDANKIGSAQGGEGAVDVGEEEHSPNEMEDFQAARSVLALLEGSPSPTNRTDSSNLGEDNNQARVDSSQMQDMVHRSRGFSGFPQVRRGLLFGFTSIFFLKVVFF